MWYVPLHLVVGMALLLTTRMCRMQPPGVQPLRTAVELRLAALGLMLAVAKRAAVSTGCCKHSTMHLHLRFRAPCIRLRKYSTLRLCSGHWYVKEFIEVWSSSLANLLVGCGYSSNHHCCENVAAFQQNSMQSHPTLHA
jgi:hypothetical protein